MWLYHNAAASEMSKASHSYLKCFEIPLLFWLIVYGRRRQKKGINITKVQAANFPYAEYIHYGIKSLWFVFLYLFLNSRVLYVYPSKNKYNHLYIQNLYFNHFSLLIYFFLYGIKVVKITYIIIITKYVMFFGYY